MTKKYLTTPIYYVNGNPHIGSAYCTLATDTIARYWRQKIGTENVFFLTGTDENSQKTVEAAAKSDQGIYEYLETMAANWRSTFEKINVSFDDFIRTTEERHIDTVHDVIGKIEASGDIYKGKYRGKYCTGCETFLKDSDLTEDGLCPDHLKAPNEIEEENYFFRLSKYTEPLLKWYRDNPNWLQPDKRRNEIVSFLKTGLEDISISRETAEMGIELPNDKEHKIYVWFDALINYYTATREKNREEFWPVAEHIIGKDITRFHCVIWPAMLMSAGLPLPKNIFAHGFFTVNGHKMSKSLGNVVDPLELSEKFGNDALRIGLLSSFEFGNDGDFSAENFAEFYRSKLAGGVGNLFNRVIVLIHKFLDGQKPGANGNPATLKNFRGKFAEAMEAKKIKTASDTLFEVVQHANERLNETEVWKLAKTDLVAAKVIFAELLGYLELITEFSASLLPESAEKMRTMLGDEAKVGTAEILFPQG